MDAVAIFEQLITTDRGYSLHVNLYEDKYNVVHILEWCRGIDYYLLACSSDLNGTTLKGLIPRCQKLPTCLPCIVKYL